MSIIQKPTKKEYRELKDFKLRVGIELYNAIQLFENANSEIRWQLNKRIYPTHTFKIGNSTFTVKIDLSWSREDIDNLLKKFTTTRW